MPARVGVYLDTSVVSAYFDAREPWRQELTRQFWGRLPGFEPVISELVLSELQATRDAARREELLALVQALRVLPARDDAAALVKAYLAGGAFTPALRSDAEHVAIAVVSGTAILASWNFQHLVNRTRRARVNLVNLEQGYGQVEILAPPEIG